jgi:metal-responsive CopG/Arc/MetJ family transcriptional regulator
VLHININPFIQYNVVKTTIDIPDEKWKKFSIKVIEEYGGRKKNNVIEELIDKYLKEGQKRQEKE